MITLVSRIFRFMARFFNNIENHIMEGSFPDSVLTFTPRNANPKLLQVVNVVAPTNKIAALKVKPDALPPGDPARECTTKKQKFKPTTGSKDFTKVGLFCCKEGTPIRELFPSSLMKEFCFFFVSVIRTASSPIRLTTLIMLGSGIRSPWMTSPKFLSTSMHLKERFG